MAGGQDAIYRMREAIRSGFKFAEGGAVGGPVAPVRYAPASQQRAAQAPPSVHATFHNYNTDAVRATREQVAQFVQRVDSMAVPLP